MYSEQIMLTTAILVITKFVSLIHKMWSFAKKWPLLRAKTVIFKLENLSPKAR